MQRYLTDQVKNDLTKKMVFIAGPRQVGKTTLAKQVLGKNNTYLNWDIPHERSTIVKHDFPKTPIIAFDEIHKFKLWRNTLKGLFDDRKGKQKILVTGSAMLGYYNHGGDSLQGRYHLLHMLPLTVKELGITKKKDLGDLVKLGGFPEPFFSGSLSEANRWSTEYQSRLLTEDVTGLESVHDISLMEILSMRLPDLVGSPLSINALREDLQVNHATVQRWMNIFDRIYSTFRVSPFGAPRIKAVKKEQKHYHYDWNVVKKESAKFENVIAVHLLKWVEWEKDTQGRRLELRYFRDIEGREVDFVITEDTKPVMFIETKWQDQSIDSNLKYLKSKFPDVPAWQLSALGDKDFETPEGIRSTNALTFLKDLT